MQMHYEPPAPQGNPRPLSCIILEKILDELSLQILKGKVKEGEPVTFNVKDEKVMLSSTIK